METKRRKVFCLGDARGMELDMNIDFVPTVAEATELWHPKNQLPSKELLSYCNANNITVCSYLLFCANEMESERDSVIQIEEERDI